MFMLLHGNANNNLSDVCDNALYNVVVHAMPGILPAGLQDLLLLLLVDLCCACWLAWCIVFNCVMHVVACCCIIKVCKLEEKPGKLVIQQDFNQDSSSFS